VSTSVVIEYLCQLGFGQGTAQSGVAWLLKKKCLEDRLGENEIASPQDQIRITSLGKFIVSELIGTFVYLDAVVVDTPISDVKVRGAIQDEQTIESRLSRGRLFKDYLDACSAALRDADAESFWRSVSDSLTADMNRVKANLGGRS